MATVLAATDRENSRSLSGRRYGWRRLFGMSARCAVSLDLALELLDTRNALILMEKVTRNGQNRRRSLTSVKSQYQKMNTFSLMW